MRRWPNYAVVGIALMLAGSQVDGQGSNLQILHRFAMGTVPSRPYAVAGLPDGAALVLAEGGGGAPGGVLRVGAAGAIAQLGPRPFPDYWRDTTLVPGGDGRYYGLTSSSDDHPYGAIWSLDASGRLVIVYRFQGGADGQSPYALFPGPGGTLYGAASARGEPGSRVFAIDRAGVVTPAVARLEAGLAGVGPDGALYSVDCSRGCSVVRQAPSGEMTTVIVPLENTVFSSVLPLPTGRLLALVFRYSDSQCHLIRVDRPQEASTTLASFDGWCPGDALQLDGASGAAFGFTERSVFRVDAAGMVTIVARMSDGQQVLDAQRGSDGTVWAALSGGAFGGGELFRIPPSGAWTRVATFPGGNHEGVVPNGPLVVDADGFMYGTASGGGQHGAGTIYRMAKDGTRFQVLYTFTGGNDGGNPSQLVKTPDGALWGATRSGDEHGGTIFRIGRSGALTTVFAFRRTEDGRFPRALAAGRDGALYGWTLSRGEFGRGTAFRLTGDGAFTVIHHFSEADGLRGAYFGGRSDPFVAADGHLYGVTGACDSYGCYGSSLFRMTTRGEVTKLWDPEPWVGLSGPLVQTLDGQLWGSTDRFSQSGTVFAAPLTGGGQLIASDRIASIATVASDGSFYGFGNVVVSAGTSEHQLVKIRRTGEVRRLEPLGQNPVGFERWGESLLDGRDGFLYGTVTVEATDTRLGAIFRIPGPGPDAPSNVRVVR